MPLSQLWMASVVGAPWALSRSTAALKRVCACKCCDPDEPAAARPALPQNLTRHGWKHKRMWSVFDTCGQHPYHRVAQATLRRWKKISRTGRAGQYAASEQACSPSTWHIAQKAHIARVAVHLDTSQVRAWCSAVPLGMQRGGHKVIVHSSADVHYPCATANNSQLLSSWQGTQQMAPCQTQAKPGRCSGSWRWPVRMNLSSRKGPSDDRIQDKQVNHIMW